MYFGPALMYSINTVALFVIVISYMVSVAPTLTMYALAPLPLLSIAIYQLSRSIHKRSTIVQNTSPSFLLSRRRCSVVLESSKPMRLSQLQTIKWGLWHWGMSKNMHLVQVQAWFSLMILLIGLSNVLVIFIGGSQFINGQLNWEP